MNKNILIAGIGGASLGTEIFKSLKLSGKYNIFGADISSYAFGLYQKGFIKTYVINKEKYIQNIFNICRKEKIEAVIPGGEEPLNLLNNNRKIFEKENIRLAMNSEKVIKICTDKIKTFDYLKNKDIPVPVTKIADKLNVLKSFPYPAVIKPSEKSGGSSFVYIAENYQEGNLYISYLKKRKIKPIIQEYISDIEGEYTVGVLHLPNAKLVGSIALKRLFHTKLSTLMRTKNRVVSSGYSQGLIDAFKKIRNQAEKIAEILNSQGSINIQGRVKNNIFYPFEINPRFSATTYLRAIAGFNEIDMYLQYILNNKNPRFGKIKHGYYLRSLDEEFVSIKKIKQK